MESFTRFQDRQSPTVGEATILVAPSICKGMSICALEKEEEKEDEVSLLASLSLCAASCVTLPSKNKNFFPLPPHDEKNPCTVRPLATTSGSRRVARSHSPARGSGELEQLSAGVRRHGAVRFGALDDDDERARRGAVTPIQSSWEGEVGVAGWCWCWREMDMHMQSCCSPAQCGLSLAILPGHGGSEATDLQREYLHREFDIGYLRPRLRDGWFQAALDITSEQHHSMGWMVHTCTYLGSLPYVDAPGLSSVMVYFTVFLFSPADQRRWSSPLPSNPMDIGLTNTAVALFPRAARHRETWRKPLHDSPIRVVSRPHQDMLLLLPIPIPAHP
ncbi:hypothetical protein G7046_g5721 [Stylonectria norvegica]|nr:hypothetical protein G7046_g5721 [Stylonectria norvegica]